MILKKGQHIISKSNKGALSHFHNSEVQYLIKKNKKYIINGVFKYKSFLNNEEHYMVMINSEMNTDFFVSVEFIIKDIKGFYFNNRALITEKKFQISYEQIAEICY